MADDADRDYDPIGELKTHSSIAASVCMDAEDPSAFIQTRQSMCLDGLMLKEGSLW